MIVLWIFVFWSIASVMAINIFVVNRDAATELMLFRERFFLEVIVGVYLWICALWYPTMAYLLATNNQILHVFITAQ